MHLSETVPNQSSAGRGDKFEDRREELARAALTTLSELGFARTSLREIAANTQFSHGVLHYYFQDKVELITYGVQGYYERCVSSYALQVGEALDAPGLVDAVAQAMAAILTTDPDMHRLWYDLRAQSLYDPSLLPTVQRCEDQLEVLISRMMGRLADLSGVPSPITPRAGYALVNGLFEAALHRLNAGQDGVAEQLHQDAVATLSLLIQPR